MSAPVVAVVGLGLTGFLTRLALEPIALEGLKLTVAPARRTGLPALLASRPQVVLVAVEEEALADWWCDAVRRRALGAQVFQVSPLAVSHSFAHECFERPFDPERLLARVLEVLGLES